MLEDMGDTSVNHIGVPDAYLLSAAEIREFQELVHQTSRTWLDDDAAARRASQLLYLTRALIGRLPEEA